MKNETKKKIIAAAMTPIAMILLSCGNDNGKDPQKEKLTGTVNIGGMLEVGKEVTIEIANSNGTADKFTYQWTRKNGGIALEIEDATGKSYTITEGDIGHYLGAIVKNADTVDSIFGEATEKVVEVAKEREVLVTGLFDNDASATVKGTMLAAEWEGVAEKIKGQLNAAFDGASDDEKNIFREILSRGLIYIVEVSPEGYANWKTIGDGKTIHIALSRVDTSSVIAGLASIYANTSIIARVVTPKAVKVAKLPKVGTKTFAREVAEAFGIAKKRNQVAVVNNQLVITK
jgi:hypothetical protein